MRSEGPAGLLLTGGTSSRMGRDKASLPLGPAGVTLGRHLGEMLAAVTRCALEVGPEASGLGTPTEADPQSGPLAAIALGTRTHRSLGWEGAILVLATDLPLLSLDLLQRIALWPAADHLSVVPTAGGRLQPLCARWSPAALQMAVNASAFGQRRVSAVFGDAGDLVVLGQPELPGIDLERELADVDDEAAIERLSLELPLLPPAQSP